METNRQEFKIFILLLAVFILVLVIFSTSIVNAQYTQLTGVKICLDPGHGGHDSNDRPTELGIGTTYYESDANWEAIGYLDTLLQKLGASVKITKITNDPSSPDREPSLSDRVQVANAFDSDYFHSFHTNGSDNKSVNYTLMLYAGSQDGVAESSDALAMAEIMDDELFEYMKTTDHFARADIPFTGFTNGLGVLNNLNMPGTLSECSFHSNLNEGRRLMNTSYRKAAAWAVTKSFLKYYGQTNLPFGELGGVITDINDNTLNGIEVTINPNTADEVIHNGDQFLNGFYFFDWLSPGDYQVKFDKFGFDSQIKTVTIQSGEYTEVDVLLTETGGAPATPMLNFVLNPDGGTGVSAGWEANSETTLLGYRLYYAISDNKENWLLAADESTIDAASTSIVINSSNDFIAIPENEVFHFKLTAVAQSGAESEEGDIYSRSSNATGDKVLIVDGFDRISGSYTNKYHDFATDYFVAIRDSKYAEVGTATNEAIALGSVNLATYDMVVWFVGDESTTDESLSDEEQGKLKSYLENGGKLFVSGSEIAWDLDNKGTAEDKAFYNDYLKAQYVGDGAAEYTPAKGISGTDFEGLVIEFGITYPEDFPDDIAPMNGSTAILDYAVEGKRGGIGYKGTFGAGTAEGGVVHISFPLETADIEDQKSMVKVVMDYLDVGAFFPIPPNQPVLHMIAGNGEGVSANWASSSEPTLIGYRLYYAIDNDLMEWKLVADEQTLDKNTIELNIEQLSNFKIPPSGQVNHYKLTAISEGGFESIPSDVYSGVDEGADINTLIVDGFDRYGGSGSYQLSYHDFAANYFNGLRNTGNMNISTVANEKINNASINLKEYSMVFWFVGDESLGESTFSEGEQLLIKDYLQNGGRLFVSGAEIGWDLFANGSAPDKQFYNNYLKATYVSDGGADLSPAMGIVDTDFSGIEIEFGIKYPEDFPDEISSFGGSEEIIEYAQTGKYGGVAYEGMFENGVISGKIVHLSFPLEGAEKVDVDETVIKIVDYFEVYIPTAPITLDDYASTFSSTPVTIDVLANDWDSNNDMDPSTIIIVDDPTNGIVEISNQQITFTSTSNVAREETFTYKVADKTGLFSEKGTVYVTVESITSIDEEVIVDQEPKIKLYPNPSVDNMQAEITITHDFKGRWDVTIYDLDGKVIRQSTHNLTNGTQILDLNTTQLNSGFYTVSFSSEKKVLTMKLLKK